MNLPDPVPVRALVESREIEQLELDLLAGEASLDVRTISNPRIQKPGLALAGYLPSIREGRVQIFGQSELEYLETLDPDEMRRRVRALLDRDIPIIVAAKGLRLPDDLLADAEERGVPFATTPVATSEAIGTISNVLEDRLAPWVQVHGVLLDVFSLGTLIVGDPGIGKSECALELVHRGHRLVADDVVVVRRTHHEVLRGRPHEYLRNFLELRGVGIVDIRKHFGMTATSAEVDVSLVIRLVLLSDAARLEEQEWRERQMMGEKATAYTSRLLGVQVPMYTMVVAPGRDVAIMVETAVRKCLLARRGIDDERDFIRNVDRRAQGLDEVLDDD